MFNPLRTIIWVAAACGVAISLGQAQAKPPELPARPNVECKVPPKPMVEERFDTVPLELYTDDVIPAPAKSMLETLPMPTEVEILTVPPREIIETPAALRLPSLPALDSGIVLALEKVEGQFRQQAEDGEFGCVIQSAFCPVLQVGDGITVVLLSKDVNWPDLILGNGADYQVQLVSDLPDQEFWQHVIEQLHSTTGLELNLGNAGKLRVRIALFGKESEFHLLVPPPVY
jgi:hypothetical protein